MIEVDAAHQRVIRISLADLIDPYSCKTFDAPEAG